MFGVGCSKKSPVLVIVNDLPEPVSITLADTNRVSVAAKSTNRMYWGCFDERCRITISANGRRPITIIASPAQLRSGGEDSRQYLRIRESGRVDMGEQTGRSRSDAEFYVPTAFIFTLLGYFLYLQWVQGSLRFLRRAVEAPLTRMNAEWAGALRPFRALHSATFVLALAYAVLMPCLAAADVAVSRKCVMAAVLIASWHTITSAWRGLRTRVDLFLRAEA